MCKCDWTLLPHPTRKSKNACTVSQPLAKACNNHSKNGELPWSRTFVHILAVNLQSWWSVSFSKPSVETHVFCCGSVPNTFYHPFLLVGLARFLWWRTICTIIPRKATSTIIYIYVYVHTYMHGLNYIWICLLVNWITNCWCLNFHVWSFRFWWFSEYQSKSGDIGPRLQLPTSHHLGL